MKKRKGIIHSSSPDRRNQQCVPAVQSFLLQGTSTEDWFKLAVLKKDIFYLIFLTIDTKKVESVAVQHYL